MRILAVTLVLVLLGTARAGAVVPGANGLIAYDCMVFNTCASTDAGAATVFFGFVGGQPAWSPDGRRVATGGAGGHYTEPGILVSTLGTPGDVQLTTSGQDPAWSPDGRQIAYSQYNSLWVVGADGTGNRELLAGSGTESLTGPEWSPDGTRIAFTRSSDSACSIDVMAADGTRDHVLVTGATGPSWSPDGKTIAYVTSACGSSPGTVRLISPDGGAPHETGLSAAFVAWSPDGTRLALASDSSNAGFVGTVAPDGTDPRVVCNGSEPAWQPAATPAPLDGTADCQRPPVVIAAPTPTVSDTPLVAPRHVSATATARCIRHCHAAVERFRVVVRGRVRGTNCGSARVQVGAHAAAVNAECQFVLRLRLRGRAGRRIHLHARIVDGVAGPAVPVALPRRVRLIRSGRHR